MDDKTILEVCALMDKAHIHYAYHGMIGISAEMVVLGIRDPFALEAECQGLSPEEFQEFLGFDFSCKALTRAGKPCKNFVVKAISLCADRYVPPDWDPAHPDWNYCRVHRSQEAQE